MKKIVLPITVSACLVVLILWQLLISQTNYYLISVAILVLSMIPFFSSFERKNHSAKEIALVASLIALAVVSRAVFYLIPQVKPIAAVVGVSGICLGAKRGYFVGALSMFVSNFLFGQGIHTPFQMVAMGFVGLAFGLIFNKVKVNRLSLAIVGFLSVFVFYGLIVDLSTVLVLSTDMNVNAILSVYLAGMPFNAVFGAVTAVFLFFFGVPFINKIERINTKYGIYSKS